MELEVLPAAALFGNIIIPADKSITHRALLLSAIAEGCTQIENYLASDDCLATIAVLNQLGIKIDQFDDKLIVHGVGKYGLKSSDENRPLDCQNSGTLIRLISGILVSQNFNSILIGDEQLSKRPMQRITLPLSAMGAKILGNNPPLRILKSNNLKAIDYQIPIASAQIKSCLLLAALYADGESIITEKLPTRDHTERMLNTFGVKIKQADLTFKINSAQILRSPKKIKIPNDFSSAAFFIVGALISKSSNITMLEVGMNPSRIGLLKLLIKSGIDIKVTDHKLFNNEPVASLIISNSKLPEKIIFDTQDVPNLIDELPILFVFASLINSKSEFNNLAELRVKETDRLQAMAEGLVNIGVKLEIKKNNITIFGRSKFTGGTVDACNDHRIAMAFCMASLACESVIKIKNANNIASSFPGFIDLANQHGLNIQIISDKQVRR